MPVVTIRSAWASNVLLDYVTEEIRTLEPDLYFAHMGVQRNVPKGYDVLNFPQTNSIVANSVSSLTEGTNPTSFTWGATTYRGTASQQGLIIQLSDLLVRDSAIEVISAAVRQVRLALARSIDNLLQTTVNAGTTIVYAGGKSTRASLAAGDLIDTSTYVTAIKKMRNANVRPFEGKYYGVVIYPGVETDLMLNTSTGAWIDIGRYSSAQELREGKMGDFRGGRILSSANVQTFASTVTVYPTTVFGEESFGWGYFQEPEPILVTTADSNNPLNVYQTVGAKMTLGVTRFEEARITRIESAVSA